MILKALREAGIDVVEQYTGSKHEYIVTFIKPLKCDKCSSESIQNRGYHASRTVIDLIDDTKIEKITVFPTRYTCGKCKQNVYTAEKEKYDAILPPHLRVTDDVKTFLIRQQLQNPSSSYSQIAQEHKLGKPIVSALFEEFLADARKLVAHWMKCDRIAIIPFNWRNESIYCLFVFNQETNDIGVFDIMSPDLVVNMLIWFGHYNIEPNTIVCPLRDPIIDDILSVYEGEILYLRSSVEEYSLYIREQLGDIFTQKLLDVTNGIGSAEYKSSTLCEYATSTPFGCPEGLKDDIHEYFQILERTVDIGHQEYIKQTFDDIKSMRSRGIEYGNIALRYIFSNPLAKEALRKTDMAKYIIE